MLSKQRPLREEVFKSVQCAFNGTVHGNRYVKRKVICRGPHLETSEYLLLVRAYAAILMRQYVCVPVRVWEIALAQINKDMPTLDRHTHKRMDRR